jgi:predicted dienelactone hydrolase
MDEKPNKIVEHIDRERNRLGENIDELEARVKDTTDIRAHFDRHPMMMMGIALGGGMLLSGLVAGASRSRSSSSGSSTSSYNPSSPDYSSASYNSKTSQSGGLSSWLPEQSKVREQKDKAMETLDNVGAALIGMAAEKVKTFLDSAMPGFKHHLAAQEHRQNWNQGEQSRTTREQAGSVQPDSSASTYKA